MDTVQLSTQIRQLIAEGELETAAKDPAPVSGSGRAE